MVRPVGHLSEANTGGDGEQHELQHKSEALATPRKGAARQRWCHSFVDEFRFYQLCREPRHKTSWMGRKLEDVRMGPKSEVSVAALRKP